MTDNPTLNHITLFRFTPDYYRLESAKRAELKDQLINTLPTLCERAHFYQVYPALAECDALVWCTCTLDDELAPARFFRDSASFWTSLRPFITTPRVLWGITRPSIYARGSSTQEIDPFSDQRKSYLIVYPFAKTAEWYLLGRETRQGMMNEHIRIGRQYPAILQLLLYSYGMQDYEFVVAYETDDLLTFSNLVMELRGTEARRYTLLDTPIVPAVHIQEKEIMNCLG